MKTRPWIVPFALVLAGALVYANSLSGAFTFDDEAAIIDNPSIRSISTALKPPTRGQPVAGRPLVNLSFALNYSFGGLNVRGYHIVNIALHVACALLLFGLVRRALTRADLAPHRAGVRGGGPAKVGPYTESSVARNVAFAAALIWVVHPLNTEAVNYLSQRTELLMAFFYLLTLYANSKRWTALAVISCAAGMACKEVMVTAPVLVVLYDGTFVYGSFRDAFAARWKFYLALASTWVLLGLLIRSGPRWESAGFSTGISVWTWLLNQAVMIVTYLRTAFWPVSLVFDYGEPDEMLTVGRAAPYASVVLVLLALIVVALWKYPSLGFAAAAFFIILAPSSSIVPIATEVGADRRMYLPLAALVVLVVVAVHWADLKVGPYIPRRNLKGSHAKNASVGADLQVGPYALAAVVVALAIATVQRNTDYRTELSLWQTTLDRLPNARAHRNYATVMKRAGRQDRDVIFHLREGVRLGHPEGRYAVGFELYEQGYRDEAVAELRQFIRETPNDPEVKSAHLIIGRALADLGRHEEAIAAFDAALRVDPSFLDARGGRADVLLAMQKFDAAIVEYEAVLAQRPRFAKAWNNLGVALVQAGREDGVREAFARAVELDPQNGLARRALAAVLLHDGDVAGAIAHAEEAVRLLPGDAAARELLELARRAAQPR